MPYPYTSVVRRAVGASRTASIRLGDYEVGTWQCPAIPAHYTSMRRVFALSIAVCVGALVARLAWHCLWDVHVPPPSTVTVGVGSGGAESSGGVVGFLLDSYKIGPDFLREIPTVRARAATLFGSPDCVRGDLRFEELVAIEARMIGRGRLASLWDMVRDGYAQEVVVVVGDVMRNELGGKWLMQRGAPYVRAVDGSNVAPWAPLADAEDGIAIKLRASVAVFSMMHRYLSPKRVGECVRTLERSGL